jgi:hypothetical protein
MLLAASDCKGWKTVAVCDVQRRAQQLDNSLIWRDLGSHNRAGDGKYGEVGATDLSQLFDWRIDM